MSATCPHCGKPVPSAALGGVCPECMLRAGMASQTDAESAGHHGTKVVSAPPKPEEIAPLFPQLEILECLGCGGMGAVYKARQPKLDRFVALKILARDKEGDPKFAERFMREARALARLNHPNIVAVHDFGEVGQASSLSPDENSKTGGMPAPLYFLTMEYVDGLSLRQLMQTGDLKPEAALGIVPRICEALQFAHEHGIVHRDIKPENILLDREGRVKIADFGIAKILGGETGRANLTAEKQVIGTPHYMAPEQIEQPQRVDHRADIYSLGVVFYEMLTGELPLGKFLPPSRKVHVDERLDEVVLHALEKEPERRYQHASEVKTDVETIVTSTESARDAWERRAPGWRIRCLKCGFTEPWGKYGIRLAAIGKKYTIGRCPRCRRIRCHVIEKGVAENPDLPARPADERESAVRHASGWLIAARWTARIFGTLLLAFYGVFILAEGLPAIASQPGGVQLNFAALGLMLLGFIAGWKREGMAALLIGAGWTLWQISESRMRWNLFQTPLPVAALYACCWWATHRRRSGIVATSIVALAVLLGMGRLFVPANVSVHGAVVDAQTGRPVPRAELRLLPRSTQPPENDDRPNARADQNGRFSLYVGWYAAQKKVAISAPGYATLTTNLGSRAPGQRRVSRDYLLTPGLITSAPPSVAAPESPPVVVRTVPESGASGVDPALTELRATFSKPMRDGYWSWVKLDDATFPEIGEPRYLDDRRTCVLPVKLQPNKVYALWINVDNFQNFQDESGRPAVPYLLIFETRKPATSDAASPAK